MTKLTDVSISGSGKIIAYAYDSLYRLTRASTTAASSTPYLQTYEYDKIGNITRKSDQGGYGYYGDIGSLYSNPHAVNDIASTTISYDRNGNMVHDGTYARIWNYRNQLTQAGGTASSTYGYDHIGRRVSMKVGANASTTYVNKLYSTTGATTTKHIFANGMLIATVEGTAAATSTHYMHTDHLSGSNVVSNSVGDQVQVTDYYPFGAPRIDTKTTGFNEQRKFIGEYYDDASTLSYLNARYYNGARGQFLSQDPVFRWLGTQETVYDATGLTQEEFLANPQHLNSYSYALNNPLRYIDPEGTQAAPAASLIIAALKLALEALVLAIRTVSIIVIGGAIVDSLPAPGSQTQNLPPPPPTLVIPHQGSTVPYFPPAGGITINPARIGKIETPSATDFEGKSKKEGERILKEKGFEPGRPTRSGGGTRYDTPGTRGSEQIRWMPGNPKDSNPIKQGPYWTGTKGNQPMPHVPAKGNPLLK